MVAEAHSDGGRRSLPRASRSHAEVTGLVTSSLLVSEKGEVLLRDTILVIPQWKLWLSSAHLRSGSLMVWQSAPESGSWEPDS